DRVEDAVVSLISAASCMADAGRQVESRRLFEAAQTLTSLDTVRAWISERFRQLPIERIPAHVFKHANVHIVDNPQLRIPQREAYMAAHHHFASRRDHAIIQLPVGCGKTGTMAVLPFDISQGRTLVVAPNLEIAGTVARQLDYTSPDSFYARTGVLSN